MINGPRKPVKMPSNWASIAMVLGSVPPPPVACACGCAACPHCWPSHHRIWPLWSGYHPGGVCPVGCCCSLTGASVVLRSLQVRGRGGARGRCRQPWCRRAHRQHGATAAQTPDRFGPHVPAAPRGQRSRRRCSDTARVRRA